MILRCHRCDLRAYTHPDDGWNIHIHPVTGRTVEIVCPACQTSDEHLEAAVRDAIGHRAHPNGTIIDVTARR